MSGSALILRGTAMATGYLHTKILWALMKDFKNEIFPPGVWPEGSPLCEMSRMRKAQLYGLVDAIMEMENPANGSKGTPFRFRKCILDSQTGLIPVKYIGMPTEKAPAPPGAKKRRRSRGKSTSKVRPLENAFREI